MMYGISVIFDEDLMANVLMPMITLIKSVPSPLNQHGKVST